MGTRDPATLLGHGTLAMTVEQGHTQQRYQGYVPLEGESLESAAHTYFQQSEQIPTRIRLAVAEMFERDEQGGARRSWRAGGIIGQFLPVSEDRVRRRDLPGGDVPTWCGNRSRSARRRRLDRGAGAARDGGGP